MYKEIEGDLIDLAKEGRFDVITHGCNCMCKMQRGIAPQMEEAFNCNNPDYFPSEHKNRIGDIKKLGNIEWFVYGRLNLTVINSYTQYNWDTSTKPFDYEAFTICMRKINHLFKGQNIGLPQIGSHLAGGDWDRIKEIIIKELSDMIVTVVIYNKKETI